MRCSPTLYWRILPKHVHAWRIGVARKRRGETRRDASELANSLACSPMTHGFWCVRTHTRIDVCVSGACVTRVSSNCCSIKPTSQGLPVLLAARQLSESLSSHLFDEFAVVRTRYLIFVRIDQTAMYRGWLWLTLSEQSQPEFEINREFSAGSFDAISKRK